MSIINDSHAIGVDTRNLVLKTRGTLHVKVGGRYYEIDFRNLAGSNEDEKEREEYIIPINSKDDLENIEYPGDNKLVVGTDGSLFVTKNNKFVDVTPKQQIVKDETVINYEELGKQIVSLDSVVVNNMLHGPGNLMINFAEGDIITDDLTVNNNIRLPENMVKNKCCRTSSETAKYTGMDFIEIVEAPPRLTVKSGVIVKSSIEITLQVNIGNDFSREDVFFEAGGLYIIYLSNNEIIQTKLN